MHLFGILVPLELKQILKRLGVKDAEIIDISTSLHQRKVLLANAGQNVQGVLDLEEHFGLLSKNIRLHVVVYSGSKNLLIIISELEHGIIVRSNLNLLTSMNCWPLLVVKNVVEDLALKQL